MEPLLSSNIQEYPKRSFIRRSVSFSHDQKDKFDTVLGAVAEDFELDSQISISALSAPTVIEFHDQLRDSYSTEKISSYHAVTQDISSMDFVAHGQVQHDIGERNDEQTSHKLIDLNDKTSEPIVPLVRLDSDTENHSKRLTDVQLPDSNSVLSNNNQTVSANESHHRETNKNSSGIVEQLAQMIQSLPIEQTLSGTSFLRLGFLLLFSIAVVVYATTLFDVNFPDAYIDNPVNRIFFWISITAAVFSVLHPIMRPTNFHNANLFRLSFPSFSWWVLNPTERKKRMNHQTSHNTTLQASSPSAPQTLDSGEGDAASSSSSTGTFIEERSPALPSQTLTVPLDEPTNEQSRFKLIPLSHSVFSVDRAAVCLTWMIVSAALAAVSRLNLSQTMYKGYGIEVSAKRIVLLFSRALHIMVCYSCVLFCFGWVPTFSEVLWWMCEQLSHILFHSGWNSTFIAALYEFTKSAVFWMLLYVFAIGWMNLLEWRFSMVEGIMVSFSYMSSRFPSNVNFFREIFGKGRLIIEPPKQLPPFITQETINEAITEALQEYEDDESELDDDSETEAEFAENNAIEASSKREQGIKEEREDNFNNSSNLFSSSDILLNKRMENIFAEGEDQKVKRDGEPVQRKGVRMQQSTSKEHLTKKNCAIMSRHSNRKDAAILKEQNIINDNSKEAKTKDEDNISANSFQHDEMTVHYSEEVYIPAPFRSISVKPWRSEEIGAKPQLSSAVAQSRIRSRTIADFFIFFILVVVFSLLAAIGLINWVEKHFDACRHFLIVVSFLTHGVIPWMMHTPLLPSFWYKQKTTSSTQLPEESSISLDIPSAESNSAYLSNRPNTSATEDNNNPSFANTNSASDYPHATTPTHASRISFFSSISGRSILSTISIVIQIAERWVLFPLFVLGAVSVSKGQLEGNIYLNTVFVTFGAALVLRASFEDPAKMLIPLLVNELLFHIDYIDAAVSPIVDIAICVILVWKGLNLLEKGKYVVAHWLDLWNSSKLSQMSFKSFLVNVLPHIISFVLLGFSIAFVGLSTIIDAPIYPILGTSFFCMAAPRPALFWPREKFQPFNRPLFLTKMPPSSSTSSLSNENAPHSSYISVSSQNSTSDPLSQTLMNENSLYMNIFSHRPFFSSRNSVFYESFAQRLKETICRDAELGSFGTISSGSFLLLVQLKEENSERRLSLTRRRIMLAERNCYQIEKQRVKSNERMMRRKIEIDNDSNCENESNQSSFHCLNEDANYFQEIESATRTKIERASSLLRTGDVTATDEEGTAYLIHIISSGFGYLTFTIRAVEINHYPVAQEEIKEAMQSLYPSYAETFSSKFDSKQKMSKFSSRSVSELNIGSLPPQSQKNQLNQNSFLLKMNSVENERSLNSTQLEQAMFQRFCSRLVLPFRLRIERPICSIVSLPTHTINHTQLSALLWSFHDQQLFVGLCVHSLIFYAATSPHLQQWLSSDVVLSEICSWDWDATFEAIREFLVGFSPDVDLRTVDDWMRGKGEDKYEEDEEMWRLTHFGETRGGITISSFYNLFVEWIGECLMLRQQSAKVPVRRKHRRDSIASMKKRTSLSQYETNLEELEGQKSDQSFEGDSTQQRNVGDFEAFPERSRESPSSSSSSSPSTSSLSSDSSFSSETSQSFSEDDNSSHSTTNYSSFTNRTRLGPSLTEVRLLFFLSIALRKLLLQPVNSSQLSLMLLKEKERKTTKQKSKQSEHGNNLKAESYPKKRSSNRYKEERGNEKLDNSLSFESSESRVMSERSSVKGKVSEMTSDFAFDNEEEKEVYLEGENGNIFSTLTPKQCRDLLVQNIVDLFNGETKIIENSGDRSGGILGDRENGPFTIADRMWLEDWIRNDDSLLSLFTATVRTALVVFLNVKSEKGGEAKMVPVHPLLEYLTEIKQRWVVCSEDEEQWRLNVMVGTQPLLSIRRDEEWELSNRIASISQEPFNSRSDNLENGKSENFLHSGENVYVVSSCMQNARFAVLSLIPEMVRGIWAQRVSDVMFFGENLDFERDNEAFPKKKRIFFSTKPSTYPLPAVSNASPSSRILNTTLSLFCDPPLGHPAYISPVLTSYSNIIAMP
ncbi:uncharacterized protein MONOS_45 [Monocercomonoides exilis]|uniref:uncharacterized protein n=1 Tax=Monocercomonoides exilis TaxID=2049356 RepID=UPI00355A870A|nr:hypothetical protein MONOS_45 [Monocercomonoides exilis]|eukprot:MONOS_45.1-p1 / transcript=MONOS_45.1 / gene=MONOS_45 / organism=Monocercomonoides_exilis_PA203 / gene_product=unspecified product / transcript_product=unspecified product / location=Mono_scaffold00001:219135-225356(+) / protein_length=2074 / sequence_SO=supercontig / SO=protein_coding / is_pseudo=false